MILTSLTLTDFGTYRGQQTISLAPKSSRPIILFGGKNGAGKSTLLEAIRLCFYGAGSIAAHSKEEYWRYLDQRIHSNRHAIIQPTAASVAVEFKYADVDGLRTYQVTRSWQRKGPGRVLEDLRVERNGAPLDEVSAEHWQDFVRDLLPPGVSSLFFFDGEKIQQLAEDSSDQQTLAAAVKSLLGLDLVERLQADLGIYLGRFAKPLGGRVQFADQLSELQEQIAVVRSTIEESNRKRAVAQEHVGQLMSAIARSEEKISAQGGSFARNRQQLIGKQSVLTERIRRQEEEIREMCSGLLPFAIIPSLCIRLRESLAFEDALARAEAGRALVHSVGGKLAKQISSPQFWHGLGKVPPKLKSELRTRVEDLFEASTRIRKQKRQEVIHHASAEDRDRLLSWIRQSTEDLPRTLRPIKGDAERLYRDLHKTEDALRRIPAEDVLKPTLEELRSLSQQLAEASKQVLLLDDEIKVNELQLAECERRIEQATEKLADQMHQASRIRLVPRVQKTLDDYGASLIHRKVLELQETVTDCFHALCRKKDTLGRIFVNPADFSVTLQDKLSRPVSKSQLSAGEKQIYAISMLWALAKTSGRPLPIIIDTPLARLDSDHRKLLARHYFPIASHQVLILSTDTEVDQSYFEDLRPAISQAYRLDFDPEEGGTTVAPGYFWRNANETH